MPSSWIFVVVGLAVVGGFLVAARKWGELTIRKSVLEDTIEAAKKRKGIENEVENLTDDELLDRIRDSGV